MFFNLNQVAAPQKEPSKKVYPLIEDKTIAEVKLTLIPGGYTNEAMGCLDSWATLNPKTGVVYLNAYATITEGPLKNRRIYHKIGVHSPKNHRYAQRGQQLIRQIFDSAHHLDSTDQSDHAINLRNRFQLSDIDDIEFKALIGIEPGSPPYPDRNIITRAITPDDDLYRTQH